MSRSLASILILLTIGVSAYAQKIVTHTPRFTTEDQFMWGPSATGFPGINRTFTIMPEFKRSFEIDTSPYTMLSFGGLKFGAAIDARFGFGVGPMEFRIEGFEEGSVGVDYPAIVDLILPEDSSFNPGETIVIRSELSADSEAFIESSYPSTGTIALDMGLFFDIGLGVEACFVKCLPRISLLPPVYVVPNPLPIDTAFKIFEVNSSGLTYTCDDPSSLFQCHVGGGAPFAFGAGPFSGEADFPYVPNVAPNSIIFGGRNVRAAGSYTYVDPTLDIIQTIGLIPVARPITSLISSDFQIPIAPDVTGTMRGITIGWTLATVNLGIPITHNQEFNFIPKVMTRLNFPDTLAYVVHSREEGDLPGEASSVEFAVGDSVSITFPCHYQRMDFTADYRMENTFSNETFDNIEVNLGFEAFEFAVSLDPYVIIPSLCFPIPFIGNVCTPEIGFPGATIPIGPLIDPDPLTLVSADFPPYFDEEWELGGFNDVSVDAPFSLIPRKRSPEWTVQHVACQGDSTGTIAYNIPNVSEPVDYQWSFGASTSNPVNVPAGRHYIRTTDANGCVHIESVLITEPSELEANITKEDLDCRGNATGSLTVEASGGVAPYSYTWSSGETTATISNKQAGDYEVLVVDANGCSLTASTTLEAPEQLSVQFLGPRNPSCYGETDGVLELYVQGGVVPYQYLWSTGHVSGFLDNLPAGFYSITILDANGCSATDSITLVAPSPLVASLTKTSDVSCYAGNDGGFEVNIVGGTPPYQYVWFNEDIRLDEKSQILEGIARGNYAVKITDAAGCQTVSEGEVFEPEGPLEVNLITAPVTCAGEPSGRIDLESKGGTPPYRYQWSNGETTEDLSGLVPGIYTVTVTDDQGCEVGSKTQIASPAPITIQYEMTPVTCPEEQLGRIEILSIQGGSPPYQLLWEQGDTSRAIQDLAEGNYEVTITDAVGCSIEELIAVTYIETDCFFIPNAFSPNGDGINDIWNIRSIGTYPNAMVRVFNKWGLTVFQTKGYDPPWDGTYNGQLLEPATYYYIVDLNNGEPAHSGPLSILK